MKYKENDIEFICLQIELDEKFINAHYKITERFVKERLKEIKLDYEDWEVDNFIHNLVNIKSYLEEELDLQSVSNDYRKLKTIFDKVNLYISWHDDDGIDQDEILWDYKELIE